MELLKKYNKTDTNKVSVRNTQENTQNTQENKYVACNNNTYSYYYDDSFETDSYSGSYSGESSPIIGIGQTTNSYSNSYDLPKPSQRQLFPDTKSNSDTNSDTKSNLGNLKPSNTTSKLLVVAFLIISICITFVWVTSNCFNPAIITSNSEIMVIDPPIDRWKQYSNHCCIMNNFSNIYRNHDCSADGKCYLYLAYWLIDNNQSFHNSSWSQKCCYELRHFGGNDYQSFCSYTCLNTEKIK